MILSIWSRNLRCFNRDAFSISIAFIYSYYYLPPSIRHLINCWAIIMRMVVWSAYQVQEHPYDWPLAKVIFIGLSIFVFWKSIAICNIMCLVCKQQVLGQLKDWTGRRFLYIPMRKRMIARRWKELKGSFRKMGVFGAKLIKKYWTSGSYLNWWKY